MADPEQQGPGPAGGGSSAAVERLKKENEALKQQLAQTQAAIVAEKGPQTGTPICFQRQGEGFCRPGTIASEGFTEVLKAPGGTQARHALIEYGEAPWSLPADVSQKEMERLKAHGFQTDRPWDPMGKADTWHLPSECPRQGGPGCPYASKPEWPGRRPPQVPQAP